MHRNIIIFKWRWHLKSCSEMTVALVYKSSGDWMFRQGRSCLVGMLCILLFCVDGCVACWYNMCLQPLRFSLFFLTGLVFSVWRGQNCTSDQSFWKRGRADPPGQTQAICAGEYCGAAGPPITRRCCLYVNLYFYTYFFLIFHFALLDSKPIFIVCCKYL